METILPAGWPRPRGYSNGIRVPAGRDLVFVAGQVGWNEREEVVSADFVEQFEQALRNVLAVVKAAGGGPEDLVRLTIFVSDIDAYRSRLSAVGAAYRRTVGRHFPTMSLVQVQSLLEEGAVVEIEATAAVAK